MMLEKARLALRITTNAFDDEIRDLIEAARLDLGIAGVVVPEDDPLNPLIVRAVLTYVRLNFGELDRVETYDRLSASYNTQKAQLSMATGFTEWGGSGEAEGGG